MSSLMAHTGESLPTQEKVLASMREYHAAGLIVCPAFDTPPGVLESIRASGIPLLVVVRPIGEGVYDFAGSDNETGAFMATEHSDPARAPPHRVHGARGRRSHLRTAPKAASSARWPQHGLRHRRRMDHRHPADANRRQGGHPAGARSARRPTAAVCYNDVVAFGAMGALGEQGMVAGRDFAIIGFDGVADAAHSNPPLSTISVDPGHLGEVAAELLLQRLREPSTPALTLPRHPQARRQAVFRRRRRPAVLAPDGGSGCPLKVSHMDNYAQLLDSLRQQGGRAPVPQLRQRHRAAARDADRGSGQTRVARPSRWTSAATASSCSTALSRHRTPTTTHGCAGKQQRGHPFRPQLVLHGHALSSPRHHFRGGCPAGSRPVRGTWRSVSRHRQGRGRGGDGRRVGTCRKRRTTTCWSACCASFCAASRSHRISHAASVSRRASSNHSPR